MLSGKLIPGMGGAMDLATGAKRVIVAMIHTAKGAPKIVQKCSLPLTSVRRVDLIVTGLAVVEPTSGALVLREVAPGVAVEQVVAASGAKLIIPGHVPAMPIQEEPHRQWLRLRSASSVGVARAQTSLQAPE